MSHGPEDAYCEHGVNEGNRNDNEMCNDDAKRVSNQKMSLCEKKMRGEMKTMDQK